MKYDIVNKAILMLAVIFTFNCNSQSPTNNVSFNLERNLLHNGYSKVKIDKLATGQLHLNANLNGVEGSFVLDTGASATIIDVKQKSKFKIMAKNMDQRASGAGGGNIRMQQSEKNTLILNNFKITGYNIIVMNLDHVNDAFENLGVQKVDGVIGADLLTSKHAIIDYSTLNLYIKN